MVFIRVEFGLITDFDFRYHEQGILDLRFHHLKFLIENLINCARLPDGTEQAKNACGINGQPGKGHRSVYAEQFLRPEGTGRTLCRLNRITPQTTGLQAHL